MNTPSEIEFKLKNLHPDTLLTKEHLLAMIEVFKNTQQQKDESSSYSSWDKEKLINDKTLSEWIGISTVTLQRWRTNGGSDGPKFVSMPQKTLYRVGEVRDWLNKRTVGSVAEATMKNSKGWKFMTDIGSLPFKMVIPTIYIDHQPRNFFDTLAPELLDSVTGFDLKWIEEGSVAEVFYTLLNQVEPGSLQEQLELIEEAGTDINTTSHIYISGELRSWTLPHLLAALPSNSHEDYAMQVEALYYLGLDFDHKDNKNTSSIELATKMGNTEFTEIVSRFKLFEKLNCVVNSKG